GDAQVCLEERQVLARVLLLERLGGGGDDDPLRDDLAGLLVHLAGQHRRDDRGDRLARAAPRLAQQGDGGVGGREQVLDRRRQPLLLRALGVARQHLRQSLLRLRERLPPALPWVRPWLPTGSLSQETRGTVAESAG